VTEWRTDHDARERFGAVGGNAVIPMSWIGLGLILLAPLAYAIALRLLLRSRKDATLLDAAIALRTAMKRRR
jgi:hypothetical protein